MNKARQSINQLIDIAPPTATEGNTVMLASADGVYQGFIAVADPIRSTSKIVLEKLKIAGIQHTVMLTGDDQRTANAIATKLGMTDVEAGLMREKKLSAIKGLKEKYGMVAMVGDGVNDSPALAAATVGIAMGGAGTDAALETADVALMGDDLEKLPYTIRLSRKALHIIKENIIVCIRIKNNCTAFHNSRMVNFVDCHFCRYGCYIIGSSEFIATYKVKLQSVGVFFIPTD